MPPTTIAESATLNTGHHWTSTKSMTAPPKKPSPARKARSARLPNAPPTMPPTQSLAIGSPAFAPRRTRSTTTVSTSTAKIGPSPSPWLKAAPVLKTRRSRSVQNRSIVRPGSRAATTHHLVSWSSTRTEAPASSAPRHGATPGLNVGRARRPCTRPVQPPRGLPSCVPSGCSCPRERIRRRHPCEFARGRDRSGRWNHGPGR